MHFSTQSIALLFSLTSSTLASSPYYGHAHLHRLRHFNATASPPIAEQPTSDPASSSVLAGASSASDLASPTIPLSTGGIDSGLPSASAPSVPIGTDPTASAPLGGPGGSGAVPPFPLSTGAPLAPSGGFPSDPSGNASSTVMTFTSGNSVITTTILLTKTSTNVHTVTAPAGSAGGAGAGAGAGAGTGAGDAGASSAEPTTTITSSSTTTETVTVIAQETGAGSGSGNGAGSGDSNNNAAGSGSAGCAEPATVTETVKSTITVTAPADQATGAGDNGAGASPPAPIVTPSGAPFPAGNGTDAGAAGSSGFVTATKCSSVGLPGASGVSPSLKKHKKGRRAH